jgi:hypothetical protein
MPFAIPALSGVMMGATALLVLLGTLVLLNMLARAMDYMLGANWLSRGLSNAEAAIQRALNAIGGWLDGMLYDIGTAIEAIPRALDEAMSWIAWSLRSKSEWLRSVIYTWIPDLWHNLTSSINSVYSWVTGWVGGLINGVYSWVIQLADGIKAWVSGLVNDVYRWITQTANAIYTWAIDRMNAIYGWVISLADGIKAWVSGLVNDIYGWTTRQLSALQQWVNIVIGVAAGQTFNAAVERAKQLSDQGIGALENLLSIAAGGVLAPAWPKVLDAVDAIAAALPGSLAAVLPRLGAIPRAIPKTLAGILAAVGAISAVGVDWIKECGVPLCRRLGGLGRDLELLQDAAFVLELLDVISDVIHDPRNTAIDAASAFTELVSDAAGGIFEAVDV